MSGIRLIMGKPGQDFSIATLSREEINTLLKDADERDCLFDISNTYGDLVLEDLDGSEVPLSFLPLEDQQYLSELITSQRGLTVEVTYSGWVISNKDGEMLHFCDKDSKGEVFPDYTVDAHGLVQCADGSVCLDAENMRVIQFIKPQEDVEPQYNPDAHHAVLYGAMAIFLWGGSEGYVPAPQSLLEYLLKHFILVRDGLPPTEESSEELAAPNILVLQGKPQHGFRPSFISKKDINALKLGYYYPPEALYTLKNLDGQLSLLQHSLDGITTVSLDFLPDHDKTYLLQLFSHTKHLSVWETSFSTLCDQDGQVIITASNSWLFPDGPPSFDRGNHQVVRIAPLNEKADFSHVTSHSLLIGVTTQYLRGDKDVYSAPESLLTFLAQFFEVVKE